MKFYNTLTYYLTLGATPFTPPPDLAGNTTSTARNITVSTATSVVQDWIGGTADRADYYSFTLDKANNFNVILKGLDAAANLKLLGSDGNVVADSKAVGNNNFSLTRLLGAGTYYLQVSPNEGAATRYSLSTWRTPFTPPADNAGNTIANARSISLGSQATNFTDWIGANVDGDDYYRFDLNNTSNLDLRVNGVSANAEMQLLDASGNSIVSDLARKTIPGQINRLLNAGTYYLRVFQNTYETNPTNYNLSISATPFTIPQDSAGNTLSAARDITLNATPTTYSDWIASNFDGNDYYRFTLDNASNFNLNFDRLGALIGLQLQDSNGNYITSISNTFNGVLAKGTYYLSVEPDYNTVSNYNLTLSATPFTLPNDLAGNTTSDARQITLNSAIATYSDWVGTDYDSDDYYTFTLNNTSNLSLTANGLNGKVNIELRNDNGGYFDTIATDRHDSFTTNRVLTAGTYYIRVSPNSREATNYSLLLSATPFTAPQDNAGNSLNNARNINVSSTTSTYTDWLASNVDSEDYYRFSLSNTSNFKLNLDGLSTNVYVNVLDSSVQVVISSSGNETKGVVINNLLAQGDYYIKLQTDSKTPTSYNLSTEATTFTVPQDRAGNTIATARNITVGTTTNTFSDWIGSRIDDDDYYRFTLREDANLDLNLSGLNSYARIYLLDSNGNRIEEYIGDSDYAPTVNTRNLLPASNYYIRVSTTGTSGLTATNYNLSLSAKR